MTTGSKALYSVAVLLFVLVMADTFLLPQKQVKDRIEYFSIVTSRAAKGGSWTTPVLITASGLKIPLPEQGYPFAENSDLTVFKGVIFQKPVKIRIVAEGKTYYFSTSILLRNTGGKILTALLVLLFIVSLGQLAIIKNVSFTLLLLLLLLSGFFIFDFLFF
jgi:hypothetical protein